MGIKNYKIYTPSEYAELMINLSLKNYFNNDYSKEKLEKLKITDLSCGTGNLLLVALKRLIEISKEITGKYCFKSSWLTGYDIDRNALLEYKFQGQNILRKYGLTGEIIAYIKDSIVDDIDEKYNIILGNPPYLGEKNHKDVFNKVKETEFGKKYYEGRMDYFYFFIEKGIDLLEKFGVLTYVTTNYWLKADSAMILRNKLRKDGNFLNIIDYNTSIFERATGQHNMIFSWRKDYDIFRKEDVNIDVTRENKTFHMNNINVYDENFLISLLDEKERIFNEKIKKKTNAKLKDIFNINQGIVSGCDKVFVTREYDEEFKEYLKPFYKSKDVMKYYNNQENKFWIYYITKDVKIDKKLYNKLLEHIEILEKRREVKNRSINWWELTWPRNKEIFIGEKILVRQRCKTNYFSYDNGSFFGSADIYYLTPKNDGVSVLYFLGYLNSKIFCEWYRLNGKHKGYNLEFYVTPLKEVPIYMPNNLDEELRDIRDIEGLVKEQIENYSDENQKKIDDYFTKLYNF